MTTIQARPRVLISTISSESGGVPVNVRFIVDTLSRSGYEPVIAFYEPYSVSPHLSVPGFRLLQRRAGSERRQAFDRCEAHAIGAWLPELEFTHYLATESWTRVMDDCCAHLTVAGNALASLPYVQTRRPFVAWISSGWYMDRKDRVEEFSMGRKLIDRTIVSPVVRRLEQSLLQKGLVLAASHYTRNLLDSIAGRPVVKDVLSVPIDTDFFRPKPSSRVRGRVGFSGRLSDPRKNLELLLAALHRLRQAGHAVEAIFIGHEPGPRLRQQTEALGLGGAVEFRPHSPLEALRDALCTLDAFVVPSHQEGLCIAALEAMACGCPVVSTRCGGPEEFVVDHQTGFLVNFDADEMADAILRIVRAPKLRRQLGATARARVMQEYSWEKATTVFWDAFEAQFASCEIACGQCCSPGSK